MTSRSRQIEERFVFGGRRFTPSEIVDILAGFVAPERRARIEDVLGERTCRVATVIEGLVAGGNVSAVMRSAEALGFQPFHVITGGDRFESSQRISQDADRWLDVYRWDTAAECVAHLRGEGYRIVVTQLDDRSVPIHEIDFTRKTALVFGNETHGVSREMLDLADERCVIPVSGFAESFNVSVAAAVALYQARQDRIRRMGHHGDLTDRECAALRAVYYLRSVGHARRILEEG